MKRLTTVYHGQSVLVCFFGPHHAPQRRVEEKEGLLGELRLAWKHRIWGEECVLEDIFAKGLGVLTRPVFSENWSGRKQRTLVRRGL